MGLLSFSVAVLVLGGCRSPKGETVQEKRDYALKMRDEALAKLYAERPECKGSR